MYWVDEDTAIYYCIDSAAAIIPFYRRNPCPFRTIPQYFILEVPTEFYCPPVQSTSHD